MKKHMASHFPVYWCPVSLRQNSQFDLNVYQLAIILTFYQMSWYFVVLNVREIIKATSAYSLWKLVGNMLRFFVYKGWFFLRKNYNWICKYIFLILISVLLSSFYFCCCALVMTLSVMPNSKKQSFNWRNKKM